MLYDGYEGGQNSHICMPVLGMYVPIDMINNNDYCKKVEGWIWIYACSMHGSIPPKLFNYLWKSNLNFLLGKSWTTLDSWMGIGGVNSAENILG